MTGTIPQSVLADANLSAGKHVIYVRGQDSAGNWGVFDSAVLVLPKTGPLTTGGSATPSLTNGTSSVALSATGDDSVAGGKITDAEYFVGDAPADNSTRGTAMTINRSATVVSVDATVPTSVLQTLTPGVNHFWVRVKDSFGLWGPALDIPVTFDNNAPAVLGAAMSPPATNGKLADAGNPGYVRISAEIQDAEGSKVTQAEAFLKHGRDDRQGHPAAAGGREDGQRGRDGLRADPAEPAHRVQDRPEGSGLRARQGRRRQLG